MTQPTTIHIVRHGDVHNPQQVLYGRLPNFRLSDMGTDGDIDWDARQPAVAYNSDANEYLVPFMQGDVVDDKSLQDSFFMN